MRFLIPTTLLITLSLLPSNCLAQAWMQGLAQDATLSFPEMQQRFADWAKERDLDKETGWRWYQRRETFHRQRANPDGSMADLRAYAEAYKTIMARKNGGSSQLSAANWTPAGPFDLPPNDADIASGVGRINCVTFHPTDAETMWVGVGQGGIWKTTNGGASWLPIGDALPMLRISDIAVDKNDPETMYICVGDYAYLGTELTFADRNRPSYFGLGIMKTTDGGNTWQPTGMSFAQTDFDGSLLRRVFIHPENSRRLVTGGTTGIWTSEDGGDNWVNVNPQPIWDIEADPSNPDVLYTSTAFVPTDFSGESGVRKSTNFGGTWTTLPTGMPQKFEILRIELAISPNAPENVYAVACGIDQGFYGLYFSGNGGADWSLQSSRADGVNILGVADGGFQGGQGTYDLTILVHPQEPQKIYVGGINMWGSEDGGESWSGVSSGNYKKDDRLLLHADQHFAAYNPLNQRFYICNDGGLYSTTDIRLGSWTDILTTARGWPTDWRYESGGMAITSFYRLGISKNTPGALIGGSQDNSTMVKYSGEWTQALFGDGMECFFSSTTLNHFFGSSQYGRLYRAFAIGSGTAFNIDTDINDVGEWTTPFAAHPTDDEGLFAAYGDLWMSDNEGDSWRRASATFDKLAGSDYAPAASAMAIAQGNPANIYITKRRYIIENQPSEAFVTTDAGDSWTNISAGLPGDLHFSDVEVDDDAPQNAWLSVSSFVEGVKVFKTDNFGADWQNMSLNLPNLPVNCILYDQESNQNTVYVGTDIGVYYINDNLSEWLPYNENMPNVIISELEQHPTSRVIRAATFGRGIWMSDPVDKVVSVDEMELLVNFAASVSPNPSTGMFSVKLNNLRLGAELEFEIVDITGRPVHQEVLPAGGRDVQHDFNLDLPYGAYFLRVKHGLHSRALRFVIKD